VSHGFIDEQHVSIQKIQYYHYTMGKSSKRRPRAIAYLRTRSAAKPGAGDDWEQRQREAIENFAKLANFKIVAEFSDVSESESDQIQGRPGFAALLDRIEGEDIRVVVEDAGCLAHKLVEQLLAITLFTSRRVRLLTADGDDLTANRHLSRKMMGHIGPLFAEYERARVAAKMRQGRETKRASGKKVEGRKKRYELLDPAEATRLVEAVALAKRLRRVNSKTGKRLSFSVIAAKLAAAGHLNERGVVYNPNSIKRMIEGQLQVKVRRTKALSPAIFRTGA